jgi:hypothetical protein
MDPITIAMALAQFAPKIVSMIGGTKAGDVAEKVLDIAKTVTGVADAPAALAQVTASPELQLEFRRQVDSQELELQKLAAGVAIEVNKTMQVEAAAEHWPTYSWRPFVGFVFGANLLIATITTAAVFISMLCGVTSATAALTQLPQMIGALAAINGTAVPILGIASWFRGKAQADPGIPPSIRR